MNIIDQLTNQPTLTETQQACFGAIDDKGQCTFYADVFGELKKITNAHLVLHRVAKSHGRLFLVNTVKKGPGPTFRIFPTQCGKGLLDLFFQRVSTIPDQYPTHSFSAEVLVFKKIIEGLGLDDLQRGELKGLVAEVANTISNVLNACVDAIREAFNAPMFDAQRRKHTKASLKNQRAGYRWIDHILNRYTRLCAIRIDLTYLKEYQCESAGLHSVTLKECFTHRERFLRQLPHWINDGALLGYMLKTEYTLLRSIHHHALIVLDGSKLCSDIIMADLIGQKWAGEITQGRGSFRNVNLHTEKRSSSCGIGDVYAHNLHTVHNLKSRVISYLCKPDPLVRWVVSSKRRLFLKSVTRPPAPVKRGRPRTHVPVLAFTPKDATLFQTPSSHPKMTPVSANLGATA